MSDLSRFFISPGLKIPNSLGSCLPKADCSLTKYAHLLDHLVCYQVPHFKSGGSKNLIGHEWQQSPELVVVQPMVSQPETWRAPVRWQPLETFGVASLAVITECSQKP